MDCRLYHKGVSGLLADCRGLSKGFFTLLVALLMQSSPASAQNGQEWRDSLLTLGLAIEKNPHSVELRLRKAAVNLELRQWEYAVEEYGRVLDLDSKNLTALYFRAYANTHQRRYALALADYEQFLTIVPKHFEAQLGLALVSKKVESKTQTMDRFNQLVQQFPDSALSYAARAGYEVEQQMLEPALYDWTEALRLQPDNIDFLVSKVDVLLAMKRKSEAFLLLQQAIKKGTPRAVLKDWLERCK